MKRLLIFPAIIIAAMLYSCEKAVLPDDGDSDDDKTTPVVIVDSLGNAKNDSTNGNKPNNNTGNGNNNGNVYTTISVDSAMRLGNDAIACVKGYIIGTCNRTINNATFEANTTTSSNILIADKAEEVNKQHIMAVCLTDKKSTREALNLADNPKNYHRQIIIIGTTAPYLYTKGLKKTTYYKFVP